MCHHPLVRQMERLRLSDLTQEAKPGHKCGFAWGSGVDFLGQVLSRVGGSAWELASLFLIPLGFLESIMFLALSLVGTLRRVQLAFI